MAGRRPGHPGFLGKNGTSNPWIAGSSAAMRSKRRSGRFIAARFFVRGVCASGVGGTMDTGSQASRPNTFGVRARLTPGMTIVEWAAVQTDEPHDDLGAAGGSRCARYDDVRRGDGTPSIVIPAAERAGNHRSAHAEPWILRSARRRPRMTKGCASSLTASWPGVHATAGPSRAMVRTEVVALDPPNLAALGQWMTMQGWGRYFSPTIRNTRPPWWSST